MNFEEVPRSSSSKSSVWHHFLRAKDKNEAQCRKCNKILRTLGGSTSGLRKHLKNVHSINLSTLDSEMISNVQPASSSSSDASAIGVATATAITAGKKVKITDYLFPSKEDTMEDKVCRMVSLDGVPFRLFIMSDDLRQLFEATGKELPKSSNTIREIVLRVYEKKKKNLINEIEKIISDGHKIGTSIDEWTSNRNRRYININLHSQHFMGVFKFRNLGLIRAFGSMSAERCEDEIRGKLSEYGLSFENNVVVLTSDGCSVMKKLGRNLPCYHQNCLAHAVQLAIVDVMYKKTPIADLSQENQQADITDESNDDENVTLAEIVRRRNENNQEISDDNDDGIDPEAEEDGVNFTEDILPRPDSNLQEFRYHTLIAKLRNVARTFRKSATKNDAILQKYIKEEHGKEYPLILDCKTRWSSMSDMVDRFLKVKSSIAKALIDLNSEISFNDLEIQQLQELSNILDILKTVIEALCRRDANLLTAQISIKFALKKLNNNNTYLSIAMAQALSQRYKERRLIQTSILQYLHNPDKYFSEIRNEDTSVFCRPTSQEMKEIIGDLVQRFSDNSDQAHPPAQSRQTETLPASCSTNKEELDQELEAELKQTRNRELDADIRTSIQVEMALFENGGIRGRYLSQAYDYLQAIPPTSVEPERVFSSAGIICNKLRTSLSDRSVNAISFLRTYYREKKASLKCK